MLLFMLWLWKQRDYIGIQYLNSQILIYSYSIVNYCHAQQHMLNPQRLTRHQNTAAVMKHLSNIDKKKTSYITLHSKNFVFCKILFYSLKISNTKASLPETQLQFLIINHPEKLIRTHQKHIYSIYMNTYCMDTVIIHF